MCSPPADRGVPDRKPSTARCRATNATAIAKLYAAKGRPSRSILSLPMSSISRPQTRQAFQCARARAAAKFGQGLTLNRAVRRHGLHPPAPGLDTVGVRVPHHPAAQRLLAAFGKPVAAPSANRSGHVSPTTADHVMTDLAGISISCSTAGRRRSGRIDDRRCTGNAPRILRRRRPREKVEQARHETRAGRVMAPHRHRPDSSLALRDARRDPP